MKKSYNMNEIIGKTPFSVSVGSDIIEMKFSDGSTAIWHHVQDCCERVYLADICGDFYDLIGHPLLVAEERTNSSENDGGSQTWTFYTFRNIGGSVDVRWYGESNGYYSESVDFELITC